MRLKLFVVKRNSIFVIRQIEVIQTGKIESRRCRCISAGHAVWKRTGGCALVADSGRRAWEVIEEWAEGRRHDRRACEGAPVGAIASARCHGYV